LSCFIINLFRTERLSFAYEDKFEILENGV